MSGVDTALQCLRQQVLQHGLYTLTDAEKLFLFTTKQVTYWPVASDTPKPKPVYFFKVGTC